MIRWFREPEDFMCALALEQGAIDAAEAYAESRARLPGFCTTCRSPTEFVVNIGTMLGAHPSLREGMVCPSCGLNNRCRLVLQAMEERFGREHIARGALLEATTALARAFRARYPNASASEFFGPEHRPGAMVSHKGEKVRQESITGFSYEDGSLDYLVHCDILEHVFETEVALAESARVLAPGGTLIFTMPFFPYRETTLVRGTRRADGSIEQHLPAEFHGDGVRSEGIYTFYHLGWDFFAKLRACGLASAEVGLASDVFCGYTGNNHQYGREAWMPAILFRGVR